MNADSNPNVILVDDSLWVVSLPTGMPAYDFVFEDFLACRHPYQRPEKITAIARMGAASDYPERFQEMLAEGIRLIHSPAEYERTSLLPHWDPLIEDWWKGHCVGIGPYWKGVDYRMTPLERADALAVAGEACSHIPRH